MRILQSSAHQDVHGEMLRTRHNTGTLVPPCTSTSTIQKDTFINDPSALPRWICPITVTIFVDASDRAAQWPPTDGLTGRRVVGPGLWRWRPKDLSGYITPASDMPALAPDPKSTEMASSVPAGRGRGQTGVAARVWFDCARRPTTTQDLWWPGAKELTADGTDGRTALALRQHLPFLAVGA